MVVGIVHTLRVGRLQHLVREPQCRDLGACAVKLSEGSLLVRVELTEALSNSLCFLEASRGRADERPAGAENAFLFLFLFSCPFLDVLEEPLDVGAIDASNLHAVRHLRPLVGALDRALPILPRMPPCT